MTVRIELMEKKDILVKLFSGDKKLPTLPVIFDKLNQMMQDPHTSNKKIADLMMKDPSIVTKVLKLCNSAMFSTRREITSLTNAITFLGVKNLKTLIFQVSLVKVFNFSGDDEMAEFDITTFWEHSLGTAYFSNLFVKKLGLAANDNYYIAGLLHDIGKLVIYQFYPEKFKDILKKQIKDNLIDYQAEEAVLGVNHNEIGGFLAQEWKFSTDIIDVIEKHHNTAESNSLTVAVVQIANLFSKAAGLGFPWDNKFFEIMGDPNWDVIAKHAQDIDTDSLVIDILGESQNVKDAVKDLLSSQ
jgi:putative nucleotidyltransferase with HDIG domain